MAVEGEDATAMQTADADTVEVDALREDEGLDTEADAPEFAAGEDEPAVSTSDQVALPSEARERDTPPAQAPRSETSPPSPDAES
jgi:hypothetical protein